MQICLANARYRILTLLRAGLGGRWFSPALWSIPLGAAIFLMLPPRSFAQTEPKLRAVSSTEPEPPTTIVIGFLGGRVSHDNIHHAEVQLAQRLREAYPPGVAVETFENRRYEDAHKAILQLLDTDRDGSLSPQEKRGARIILYGHSWGAWAVVALSRALEHDGIPVLLTIQVDSIARKGQTDAVIPSNVLKAVNFYQPHGFLRGQPAIVAADPARTQILGNFRFDYSKDPVTCEGYPWWDVYLAKDHTEIECDPKVWSQIEGLIREQIPVTVPTVTARAQ
jgi:hypothetical protein